MVKCIRHINVAQAVNGHAFEITKLGIAIRAVGEAARTIDLSLPNSAESIGNDGRLGGTFDGGQRERQQQKRACLGGNAASGGSIESLTLGPPA